MNKITKLIREEKKLFKFNKSFGGSITLRKRSTPADMVIFERLQSIGLKKYKKDCLAYHAALPSNARRKKKERAGLPGRYK